MKRILLTGMSGVGKSAIVRELVRRGYRAVDVDEADWSFFGTLDEDVPDAASEDEVGGGSGLPSGEPDWLWRADQVGQLLADEDGDVLFLAGCAPNQRRFYTQFDHVVLLTASVPVTIDRVATRTTNPFGKDPDELAKILADKETFEPLLRRGADHEIDADAPLDQVVDQVLALART